VFGCECEFFWLLLSRQKECEREERREERGGWERVRRKGSDGARRGVRVKEGLRR